VPTPEAPAPAPSGDVTEPLRILLVEDEALIRLGTADTLGDLGHRVLEAEDAAQALNVLESQPVDLMITDIRLPGMSGVELAATARRRRPELRVVFASGLDAPPGADDEDARAGIWLRKPYSERQLVDALRLAMG
jgi:CheY-like chemotaxis protein